MGDVGRRLLKRTAAAVEALAPGFAGIARDHYYKHGDLRLFLAPRSFNELVQHKKLWNRDPLIPLTCDKLRVRDYVEARVGARYLVPLLAVAAAPSALDLASLPSAFVVKANHGAGFNYFVEDKAQLDRADMARTLAAWLATDHSARYGEWGYRTIARRLIVEARLAPGAASPADYKFFVFGGRVRMIQLDQGRHGAHRQNLFDEAWRPLDVTYVAPPAVSTPPAPAALDEMIGVAQMLAAPFAFARVDLYLVEGSVYFGEVTHYPNAGLVPFTPRAFDHALGAVWRRGARIPDAFYRAR